MQRCTSVLASDDTGKQPMSTTQHLTTQEYDRMIENGAFEGIDRRIELIRGELRETSPADPIHDGIIQYHPIAARTRFSM
jgi:hypothetical protein